MFKIVLDAIILSPGGSEMPLATKSTRVYSVVGLWVKTEDRPGVYYIMPVIGSGIDQCIRIGRTREQWTSKETRLVSLFGEEEGHLYKNSVRISAKMIGSIKSCAADHGLDFKQFEFLLGEITEKGPTSGPIPRRKPFAEVPWCTIDNSLPSGIQRRLGLVGTPTPLSRAEVENWLANSLESDDIRTVGASVSTLRLFRTKALLDLLGLTP